ncbi:hypothetical protein HDV06_005328 [Boothiomyces sp. JEL0866]|nr:hypothetical protein HDV06_005328 [Boothiomyces sp. JEL0866]
MQYSGVSQIICTVGFIIYSILSKHELIGENSSVGYLPFDKPDLAKTTNSVIQFICPSLLIFFCVPVYLAGLLQILCVDAILRNRPSMIRSLVLERPALYFSLAFVPGVICFWMYWTEMLITNAQIYSVNGAVIAANNTSFTVAFMYSISLFITFYACYGSITSYQHLKENRNKSLGNTSQSGIPAYVVFQVFQLGYLLPFVGFIKAFELLIWIFPSFLNVYLGTFGLLILMIVPFLTFFNNGSHKAVYSLVPLFSSILEKVHLMASDEKNWDPFYNKKDVSETYTIDSYYGNA